MQPPSANSSNSKTRPLPGLAEIRKHLTYQMLVRVVADTILINIAVLLSLAARLLYIIALGTTGINYRQTFWDYLRYYSDSAWLLTIICLIVFAFSGFYTYGRFYRGRYKVLFVVQAVSLAYLIFGLLAYVSQGIFFTFLRNFTTLPRGVLILSWLLTMFLLVAARLWTSVWRRVTRMDRLAAAHMDSAIRSVLVIGGAGYIGSALLPRLLDAGYHVRVMDLLLYGLEPIEKYASHPNLDLVQADFRLIDKVVSAMQGMDAVIHLGGIVGDPACDLDGDLTLEINLTATRLIAEVAKGVGVKRFIFASTSSVYGSSTEMIDERSELRPVSLYARSKLASEKILLKMADDTFHPVILRFGTVYGLSGRYRFDLVVNLLTAKAVVDKEITVFGGEQWRPFLHVDDAAQAIFLALKAPLNQVRNQVFNVGSNEQNFTVLKVGQLINERLPDARLVIKKENIDPNNYQVSSSKISKVLEFAPRWTVQQGIDQVIDAIREGKIADYRDARYSNVKFLRGEAILRLNRHEEGWAYQIMNGKTPEADIAAAPTNAEPG